jgi:ABC-type uncharacterized transport system substrate-binding protein
MLYAFKRLALGIFLIASTSAILLLADRGRQAPTGRNVVRIAILQHANTPVLDEGIRGVIDALASRGYHEGGRVVFERFNAQGDMPTGVAIARQVTGGGYDLVITSSTPSMQAVANNNREGKVRHVFTLVANPFASGVGLDRAHPLKHPPHMVGQGSFPPVGRAFQLARRMLPGLQRVGVAWNPAETNSLVFVEEARKVSKDLGVTLLEANVDNTPAVTDAISSLIGRGAQALWVGGDNTVIAAIETVIAIGRRMGVPVFTILPGAADRGSMFDAGPDFYEVGRQGGFVAADVLDGADMAKIPIRDVLDLVPPYLSINTTVLKGLKEPWRVPDDVLNEATVIVDDTGIRRKGTAAGTKSEAAPAHRPLTRKWRISLIELNRILDVEEAESGVLDGLRESGLVEGRDFEKTIRDAQGDMATVSGLIDAAVADHADLLITFSTPTLQAALQRAKQVPVIFNYVADPIAAGAGVSATSHAPNVTGVYLMGAYEPMLQLLRAYLPGARVLGTVYVPAEVNMVSQREALIAAARAAGMELKAVAANSSAEVADAALALVAQHVDAICQLPGNLTAAAFASIAQASQRARIPIFAFQSSSARAGAVAVLARDYYDSGREAARLAARVMRGESPAGIPFVGFAETKLIVNVTAARALGIEPPPAIVARADEVIGR